MTQTTTPRGGHKARRTRPEEALMSAVATPALSWIYRGDVRVGAEFVLRGRRYTIAGFEGTCGRAVNGVERLEGLKVWREDGRMTRVTLKETDRVTIL